jgi:hypothetical protein
VPTTTLDWQSATSQVTKPQNSKQPASDGRDRMQPPYNNGLQLTVTPLADAIVAPAAETER